jgi:hypothetical protein
MELLKVLIQTVLDLIRDIPTNLLSRRVEDFVEKRAEIGSRTQRRLRRRTSQNRLKRDKKR